MLKADDLEMVLNWRNSERIRRNMLSDHLISWEEHQGWFAGLDQSRRIGLIFELNQRPVGLVNISGLDEINQKCTWGFYLGEEGLPAGTGLLMGYHGLEYIFAILQIRKLSSQALAFNHRSIRYHQKLGFKEEGLLVAECRKNDHYEDVVLFALFNQQWQVRKQELARMLEGILTI